jgi:hypothetical protein
VPKMQATIEFVSGYVRQQVQPPLRKGHSRFWTV